MKRENRDCTTTSHYSICIRTSEACCDYSVHQAPTLHWSNYRGCPVPFSGFSSALQENLTLFCGDPQGQFSPVSKLLDITMFSSGE